MDDTDREWVVMDRDKPTSHFDDASLRPDVAAAIVECWAGSDIGLIRHSNQDWAGCFADLGLAIVADGMGGHSFGEVASRLAGEVTRNQIAHRNSVLLTTVAKRRYAPAARLDDLSEAVRAANREIHQRATGPKGGSGGMGTTIVALWAPPGDDKVVWSHVGDSRLYRFRDGEIELLTADHTKLGRRYWNASSVPLDLPHTNLLSRALGIEGHVTPSRGSAPIVDGDVYLLCSDGISGVVPAATIRDTIASATDLSSAGGQLLHAALTGGGPDNASVALVRFDRTAG